MAGYEVRRAGKNFILDFRFWIVDEFKNKSKKNRMRDKIKIGMRTTR